ncbi:MAG TPA: secretin N-terminal domain-containing protein [Sedimentisphaerales bacterium]|nr:secretin N-terminal domain-containing protein [Sedimentisphaerales bacterium]
MRKYCESKQVKILAVLMVILGLCAASFTQGAAEPAADKKVPTAVDQKMLKKISVEFRDTPIDDVIRTIAKQVDLDIVKGPDVTGNVTATLTDVPLQEALSHILSAYGAGYVASENMIRIVPASQLTEETEKTVSRVYRIVYADVTEAEKALTKIMSKRGSISSNPGTSNIMIIDTESNIAAIDAYIEEIDRRTAQILVEARIYDVSNTDSLDLGVKWRAGRNTGYSTGRGTGLDTLLPTGGPVADTPGSALTNSDPFMSGRFGTSTNQAGGTTGTLDFGFITRHVDIDMLMSAERTKDAAKLLANPRILVLDNEQATFKAVREIPYQQLQQGGYQSFGTTEFKDVGVELRVTPHLAKDGMIRLRIVPVYSVYIGNVDLSLAAAGNITMPPPIVDTREADTIALVRDGDTVVIGGLRKEEVAQQISKIPLLSDIPLLGALFKFEGEKTINSELIVFITPRVIEESLLTESEAEHLRQTEIPSPKPPSTKIDPSTRELR